MDRLFLDANVLFSAAYRKGSGLLRLWQLKGAKLLSSAYAIEEASRNLPHADQRTRLKRLCHNLEVVEVLSARRIGVRLPAKDEPILRAALAGRATHLITGDVRHFGPFFGATVEGVVILRPAEYLGRRLGRPGQE